MIIRSIFLLLSLIASASFSSTANASIKVILDNSKTLILSIESEYVLGDSDTRIDARNIALQNAKQLATESAGPYIKSESTIVDDEISKSSVIVASSAVMKTEILSEKYQLTQGNRSKISLTAQIEIDKKSLFGKLDTLSSNDSKRNQVLALQKKNSKLLQQLENLNRTISNLADKQKKTHTLQHKPDDNLLKQRDQILSKLVSNENSIRKTFDKGSLFSLASQSSNKYEQAKNDINENIFSYIKNNANIQISDPEFKDNGNDTYDLEIRVKWKIDHEKVLPVFNKYFWGYKKTPIKYNERGSGFSRRETIPHIEINKFSNQKADKKLAYSDKLYSFLASRSIYLQLKAGNKTGVLKIAGIEDTFGGCSGYCYKLNTRLDMTEKSLFDQNPIVIKNVSRTALEKLTSIDAQVVVR